MWSFRSLISYFSKIGKKPLHANVSAAAIRSGILSIKAPDPRRISDTTSKLMQYKPDDLKAYQVSVIMPTYNRASEIGEAIKSVLEQTFSNFELIIVDDGSADNTSAVVGSFVDSRIKYLQQENQGVSAARNHGLNFASGNVIAFLDSDNTWGNRYLELSLAQLHTHGAHSAYSILRLVDEQGRAFAYRDREFDAATLSDRNYIDLNVFIHRRDADQPLTKFDTRLRRAVDWDYIVRIVRQGQCSFGYFTECNYKDTSSVGRLTVSEYGLYTKVVQAKNYFSPRGDLELLRLSRFTVAIHTSGPLDQRAKWGDYYYARGLQKYLILLGYSCEVFFSDSPARLYAGRDIHIDLRGRRGRKLSRHKLNVLWIISHPEVVMIEECSAYDHVFAASEYLTSYLRAEGLKDVSTLLQASDPDLFNDEGAGLREGAAFVGRTRAVARQFIMDTIQNYPHSFVVGDGWEKFLPAEKIRQKWVDYHELPAIYRASKFVLSEHWRSMRLFGIVANRVSDAIGAGATVVSDKVRGDERLYHGNYFSSSDVYDARNYMSEAGLSQVKTSGHVGFVSMQDQAAEIDSRLRNLIFRQPLRDQTRRGVDEIRIDCNKGRDWQLVEWEIINFLLPSLPYETVLRLRWAFSETETTSVLSLNDQETTVDRLIAALGGVRRGRLDEKIWRIFSVGKSREPSKNILTIISDDAEATRKKYCRILDQFQNVRTWDPLLTTRFASTKSHLPEKSQLMKESARYRIRKFLEDSAGSLMILDAPSVDQKLYTQIGFATGHSVAVEESVYRTLVSDQIWGKKHLYPIVDGQIDGRDRLTPRNELRDEFWSANGDEDF